MMQDGYKCPRPSMEKSVSYNFRLAAKCKEKQRRLYSVYIRRLTREYVLFKPRQISLPNLISNEGISNYLSVGLGYSTSTRITNKKKLLPSS